MTKQDDGTSIFDTINATTTGAGVAYWQYRRAAKRGIQAFVPTLNPQTNILSRIQSINIDESYNRAIKRFELEHALRKVSSYENQIDFINRQSRAQFVRNINDIRGQLQEYMLRSGPNGPNYTSHSPVLNMSSKTFETLKESAVLSSNQSLVRTEWQAAINATFPNPAEAKMFASSDNIFESIRASLRGNNSILMQRAFSTFEHNVDKLLALGETQALGMLPVSSFIKSVPSVGIAKEVGLTGIADARLQATIGQIQTELDRPLMISRRTIEGLSGQGELQVGFRGAKNPLFVIPESFAASEGAAPGLIRTGAGLHNVYAPGIFGIADDMGNISERLTYSQYKAQRILDTIMAKNLKGDTADLSHILGGVDEDIFKLADYMEPNISGRGFSLETLFKGNQITVLDKQGKAVQGDARRHVAQALYAAGATPAGAGSRFNLTPEKELYGPFASELDYARKPWQFSRQYTPTASALDAIRAGGLASPEFDFLDSPTAVKTFGGPTGARMKTLYLNDQQLSLLNEKFGMTIGDGELLLHERMKQQLQVSRIKRINLQELNTRVADMMKAGGVSLDNLQTQINLSNMPYKGILGRSPEGKILTTRYDTELIGLSPSVVKRLDQTTNTGLDVLIKETINMTDSEKVFGSLKGMARFVETTPDFLAAMSSVTGRSIEELSGIEAFARAGDIKDNARKLSALTSNFILEARNAGIPVESSALVSQLQNMSPDAAEAYLGNLASQQGFRTSLSVSQKTGGIGVAQLSFGGTKELTGAGQIGTVEPRIFTLLEGSNPAQMGNEISDELLERMVRWSPERVAMQQELMKTLKSLKGSIGPTEGSLVVEASEVGNKAKMEDLYRRGGFIKTGVNQVPQIYIPGYETVPQLHPRLTGTGAIVDSSEPGKIFRNIVSDIKDLSPSSGRPLSSDEFISRFEEKSGHLTRLFQEAAVGGKGAGAIARGKLPGSRALTILSESNPVDQGAFETSIRSMKNVPTNVQDRIVGLPVTYGQEMFEEMKKLYGAEAIAPMEKRFMSGELVAGMGMRHPTIGPYSMQPVLFKAVHSTNAPELLITERMKDFTFAGPAGEFTKAIQMGPLTGLAADKDIDPAVAMLLAPGTEEKLRNQMLDSESTFARQAQQYRDHSIRMQLLKPKAIEKMDVGVTAAERRAAEATKLALTAEEVGQLSTSLTKSRVAVMASNLPSERKLRALSLLEWTEQQPISGKHLAVKQALSGMFETQLDALRSGAGGNAALFSGAINEMTEGIDSQLKPLFQEGLQLKGGGSVSGFQIAETAEDIAGATRELRALPAGAQLAAATRYSTPSTGTSLSFNELANAIMANETRAPSAATKGARSALAAINRELGSAANKARPFAKPLALGALAAGATMAVMSSPSTMPPPSERPAPASDNRDYGSTQITNATRDDVEIPGVTKQVLGEPTMRPQLQQKAAQLDQSGANRRKSLRATIRANGITPEQREALVGRVNSRYPGSRIHVNLQDDRRTLNPHSISDMID